LDECAGTADGSDMQYDGTAADAAALRSPESGSHSTSCFSGLSREEVGAFQQDQQNWVI
jgi:hypothetical protein